MPYIDKHNQPERVFILYSAVNDQSISNSLGIPDYSYYFVCKGFADVLQMLGEVRIVKDPVHEVNPIYEDALKKGQKCLFFCFSPPNKAVLNLPCPTVIVFAWEFDTIPQSSLGMEGLDDWTKVLKEVCQAISLSTHTEKVVKKTLGESFKISAIPVPVPILEENRATAFAYSCAQNPRRCFEAEGLMIDTTAYEIGKESIKPLRPTAAFPMKPWNGEKIELIFSCHTKDRACLCGFYPPESWGAWTCLSEAWVLLPKMVAGEIILELELTAYGANIGRTIAVSIGHHKRRLLVDSHINEKRLSFSISEPANILTFSNLDARSIPEQPDPRSMAIGLIKATLKSPEQGSAGAERAFAFKKATAQTMKIDGILYTAVLNPKCGRKNWKDLITAFFYAFRDNANATLLIKASSAHHSEYFTELHELIARLQPFQCRMIVLHGYIDAENYRHLVELTDVYVNTSKAEGLCLPLMEFMGQGKPAISPRHTALLDYVNEKANFLVSSSDELSYWPHDPKEKYTTLCRRIDWASLRSAFTDSYDIVVRQPDKYRQMSDFAKKSIAVFASRDRVKEKLESFIR